MDQGIKQAKAKIFLWLFLPLTASVLLHSLLLTPLYLFLASNVEWNTTFLPQTIGYLQLLLEYAFFWLLFVYLIRVRGKRKLLSASLLIFACLLFRHGLELFMGYLVMGFPTLGTFFSEEFSYTLLQLLFDGVLLALAALLIRSVKPDPLRAFLLSALPFVFQIISLAIMLIGFGTITRAEWLEAGLDLVVHIVCLFAGAGAIYFLDQRTGREIHNEETLQSGAV